MEPELKFQTLGPAKRHPYSLAPDPVKISKNFWLPAPERFGRKNTENQCNICTTLKFDGALRDEMKTTSSNQYRRQQEVNLP